MAPFDAEDAKRIDAKYRALDKDTLLKKDYQNRRKTWKHNVASGTAGGAAVVTHGITAPAHGPVGYYHLQKGFVKEQKAEVSEAIIREKGFTRKEVTAMDRMEDVWDGAKMGASGGNAARKGWNNVRKSLGL